MKKILSLALVAFATLSSFGQAAFVLPSPTAADEQMTLYIDVAQSTGGGLKAMLGAHPEYRDSVYIWTWQPSGPVVGNGEWGNSNQALKMTWEGNMLYSLTFTPTVFYGVDGPTFFARGISCLAKLDNGNAFSTDNVGEAKTEDLSVTIIPKLCDKLYCAFPELSKADDFLTITYDNSKETNTSLQNMGTDDCYIYLYASYAPFQGVEYAPATSVTSTPALKLKYIGDHKYRITILAADFFAGVPSGETIDEVKYYVLRPGFTYTSGVPPIQTYSFLSCE